MRAITDTENLRQFKIRFSLIAERVVVFPSHPNMVREVKYLKQIAWRYFTLLNISVWIVRSILTLTSKQLHQKLYSDNFYIVDITCRFL